MALEVSLTVNHKPIEMIGFVVDYAAGVTEGLVRSLHGAAPAGDLELVVENDTVTVSQGGTEIAVNEFVTKIVRSTLLGMVTVLKGVKNPRELRITVKR